MSTHDPACDRTSPGKAGHEERSARVRLRRASVEEAPRQAGQQRCLLGNPLTQGAPGPDTVQETESRVTR